MKLSASFLIAFVVTAALAATTSAPIAGTTVPVIPGGAVFPASCTRSTCACNGIRGQFCGNQRVNPACIDSHVYECNPAGYSCDYGVRDSCARCHKLKC
ncbi:hypothetical protein CYLTODRAFT_44218 [Cylindrobasidium torrendii FP15055 ss-10]|uniref:Uncharacterized protein n=1 Tax=Cylindrobasidium torrendii FP15055 ss-10 TaxID=1314674 RepID=A0A0D7B672_9AGAR|nr:hypothetical protein CYLTODRAFT_44218 [Cylindrobasidium torrendii FP15055 ss-10]